MKTYNSLNFKVHRDNILFEDLFIKWVHEKFFKNPGIVCDVGSGIGNNSIAFKKRGYNVFALDNDAFYFERMKSQGIKCIDMDFDSQNLPFKDNSVDYFFMKSVIEHLQSPLSFLREANRCLKKGGKVFILTPNWSLNYRNFYHDPTHKSPFTLNSIKKALQMNGFKINHLRNFRNIPYIWREIGTNAFDFIWFFPQEMIAVAEKI